MNFNEKLIKKGFFYHENFISPNLVKLVSDFFNNQSVEKKTIKYEFNKLHNYPILFDLEKKIYTFLKVNLDSSFYLRNIWLVKSEIEDYKKNGRQYSLHIDRKRYLKVFLFVEDVNLKDGPFTVSLDCNIEENEMLRIKNLEDQASHGISLNLKNTKLKPMAFKAGTIVCFDTNCPHFAGEIKEDGCRKVLRFNYNCNFSSKIDFNFMYNSFKNKYSSFKNYILNKS